MDVKEAAAVAEVDESTSAQGKKRKQESKANKGKKVKKMHDPAMEEDLRGNKDLLEEERESHFEQEEEVDPLDVQALKENMKTKRMALQKYEADALQRGHSTTAEDRGQRWLKRQQTSQQAQVSTRSKMTKLRAEHAGKAPEELSSNFMWMNMAPRRKTMLDSQLRCPRKAKRADSESEYDQVTPTEGRVTEVRLGVHSMRMHENEVQALISDDDEDNLIDDNDEERRYQEGVWAEDELAGRQLQAYSAMGATRKMNTARSFVIHSLRLPRPQRAGRFDRFSL